MPNVYVEPRPKARPEGTPVDDFVIEHPGGASVDGKAYKTQADAIAAAKALGHRPLVSRVRHTDKGKPDQWREA